MKTFLMAVAAASFLIASQEAQAAGSLPADVRIDGKPGGKVQLAENGESRVAFVAGHRVSVRLKDGEFISAEAEERSGRTAKTSSHTSAKGSGSISTS